MELMVKFQKLLWHQVRYEEAFYDTAEAFNLAEEYQCPVIILTDLQLSLRKTNG